MSATAREEHKAQIKPLRGGSALQTQEHLLQDPRRASENSTPGGTVFIDYNGPRLGISVV